MSTPRQLVEERRAAVAVRAVRPGIAELLEDLRRGRRQERRGSERDHATRLDEVAEDDPEPFARRLVAALPRLGQRPRLLRVDDLVGGADEREDFPDRL